jgi:hypothetical protein
MRLVLLFLLFLTSTSAMAASAFERTAIVLLQPDSVIEKRVLSVPALGEYMKSVESAVASAVKASSSKQPSGGFVVVAVRPGKQSNVWLDFHPPIASELARAVISETRAVPPCDVKLGPVVFALRVSIWGGASPASNMPRPLEWVRAAEQAGSPIETGKLVEQIWEK